MTKRLLDIALSMVAILVLLPLFILISIVIKLTSPGPVIYRQTRIGYGGRPFTIYKFRSMHVNRSPVCITLSNDARITHMGRLLRNTKLDELPQLWNILKGDMSFVGPRPDVPGYSDKLTGTGRLLWTVRPGLTGLDSVIYRNEAAILDCQPFPQEYYDNILWPQKVGINVYYVKNQSFYVDLIIMLATVVGRNIWLKYLLLKTKNAEIIRLQSHFPKLIQKSTPNFYDISRPCKFSPPVKTGMALYSLMPVQRNWMYSKGKGTVSEKLDLLIQKYEFVSLGEAGKRIVSEELPACSFTENHCAAI